MKTYWPLALIALFLVCCTSENPASDDPVDGDSSSSSYEVSGSSGGHHHHRSSSSSGANPGKPDVVQDTLIHDTTTVSDVDDLPECTSAKEGESFLVKSENILRFCVGGEWIASDVVKEFFELGCRDGMLVLNGAGEETVESSSSHGTTSPWGGNYGNFGGQNNSTIDSLSEPRMVGVHISGAAQKGPFRYGTSVKIVELDSMQRLGDSKRTHRTCITDASGNYSFDSVDLVSPYLRIEANGYFQNELTGGISSHTVTLKAVVDVTNRDTVNVNMLTHMEAERVLKLVENSGNNQPIRTVKAQALKEILSSFEIRLGGSSGGTGGGGYGGFGGWGQQQQTTTSTDGRFAEDISLFDGDEYSAALLAVSIMMQRKGSGSEMLQYASGIAERIKGNGNWDDNNAKADLADWLMVLDTSGAYETIRSNVASWNKGTVPDFEKHLRNFWTGIYQFGSCSSMNAGTVKYVNNSLSKFFISYYEQPEGTRTRFICDAETHQWRTATDIEKDTVGFGRGDYDGQIRNGKINADRYYVYEQSKGKWREATSDDIQEFEDIKDVYASLGAGERVIFILRHAERGDDTGKNGHLTSNGKKQSQSVGEKLKGGDIVFANSTYTRSKETCESFATGAGATYAENTIEELDGEWYVKNDSKFESYKNSDGGGWVVVSAYAYKGAYTDAFYDFDSRSEEFLNEVVKPGFARANNRVQVWISHDVLVTPITVYFTNKKVNLRYFDTKRWINYLAGIAIIMDSSGNFRYVPVRGLDNGTMTM
ncbi:MAG: histidine phosphatase family protein [Fibrobacter sp.]|uniref:histidine phosphatase family protein n=1 Tax=Fibrobacter sp. TaxID=35828 RepID=UPI0025BD30A0|nr:histidine phosphatase family protein [Fibrobacter sp.]MBR4786158.1 histidine phosphatase family protein [Fibrobacter sp.]